MVDRFYNTLASQQATALMHATALFSQRLLQRKALLGPKSSQAAPTQKDGVQRGGLLMLPFWDAAHSCI